MSDFGELRSACLSGDRSLIISTLSKVKGIEPKAAIRYVRDHIGVMPFVWGFLTEEMEWDINELYDGFADFTVIFGSIIAGGSHFQLITQWAPYQGMYAASMFIREELLKIAAYHERSHEDCLVVMELFDQFNKGIVKNTQQLRLAISRYRVQEKLYFDDEPMAIREAAMLIHSALPVPNINKLWACLHSIKNAGLETDLSIEGETKESFSLKISDRITKSITEEIDDNFW